MTTTDDKKSEPLHGPNLILDVENFGPIAEAKNIEFKPMTVFVGPSNTGKSYLAILLHAIAKGVADADDVFHQGRFDRYGEQYDLLRSGLVDALGAKNVTTTFAPGRDEPYLSFDWATSSQDVQLVINTMHSEWLESVTKTVGDSIMAFFGITSIDELALVSDVEHAGARFNLCSHDGFFDWNIGCDENLVSVNSSLLPLMLHESVARHLAEQRVRRGAAIDDLDWLHLLNAIHTSFAAQFHKLEHLTYFPASRSGIIATHRTLNRTMVSSFARYGLNPEVVVPYNRVINDFLENLLRVNERVHNSDDLAVEIAGIIEQSLTNGTIATKDAQYGPPEFVYSRDNFSIPLTRSSSMVTELAPIILFLKHFLRVGHLLIIEEPEAHLHPAAQQKFAAALALLVRNGFRVLITTHSHYMVEQISDFVAASHLSPEKRRELLRLGPILEEQDIYLEKDEVGVYGFDNSTGKTEIKEIPFDESFAYVPEDHNLALTEQFNRNVRIMRAQSNGHSVNGRNGS